METGKETNGSVQQRNDEVLFETLEKRKKKKRRRTVITVILITLVVLAGVFFGAQKLKKRVDQSQLRDDSSVKSYTAKRGSISTTVTGYGTLANVDEEEIEIPSGVNIIDVTVKANEIVKKGDVLATIEPASVLDAMTKLQSSIASLDESLEEADNGQSTKYVNAGVTGRVKKIYAEVGESVTDCMYDHGALVLLSLDGYMACDIDTSVLSAGDGVTVSYGGKTEKGSVERVVNGKATVILSDISAAYGEKAEIISASGEKLGEGILYIHSPLRITAVAGTVHSFNVKEGDSVTAGSCILALKNSEYAATYEYLIKQRTDLEEDLLTLNELYRDGALLAPYDGTVIKVNYDKNAKNTTTTVQTINNQATVTTVDKSKQPISVLNLSPDREVKTTISIDETDILAVKLGQTADITISSIGEDKFRGTVTEINRAATTKSNSGVTKYTAIVTFPKTEKMLTGMTANVAVNIEGVENAVLIPSDAVHRTSTTSFVYTSYNRETQEYGDVVQIETGLSNGDYIEVRSGLDEGTQVYYEQSRRNRFGFGGYGGFDGGYGGFDGGYGGINGEVSVDDLRKVTAM